ncbi:fatty acyl-CoA reductase 1-like isoform X1 [Sitodiplosis mosellana]|uniref:fatty acyl-CoA reductase 1-like isoform X1 n=1 Tax=Sitodiplosis mosellana TaxID=263140 RepID=UPI0024453476|nr:fatty acyl-CoA reductase 1-like isoform X1 [Sitodiplosis mosellana]
MAGVKVYKNRNKLIERYADLADGDDLVSNFYKGSVVFITGGTGFIGKVLVEKLLRVFSIKRIYLLVRVKDDMPVDKRLENFFQESIFDRLRKESPDVITNVKAIEANFEAHDLNISQGNKDIIWNEVDIVFNVVASVKFNEKLRDAVEINVLGTKKILDLVMGIKNLKAFLHISTLYSNCDRRMIEEKVYESDIAYEKIIQVSCIALVLSCSERQ